MPELTLDEKFGELTELGVLPQPVRNKINGSASLYGRVEWARRRGLSVFVKYAGSLEVRVFVADHKGGVHGPLDIRRPSRGTPA